ncbi:MAG TPA: trypsin-like peptidase domain-containing protein [Symbiobacteriaceae bacterium]|nr:trypsin-like peptidase domain-containing protein [Symbiobacteriaceae bacterium]
MMMNSFAQEPFARVASQVGPSVVQVRSGRGQGSGVLLGNRSVITNAHVVGNNPTPSLTFADGVTRSGRVLATDRAYDLALVETDPPTGAQVGFAPEESIVPGKLVVAIGNPYGFGWTVTTGVVSSVDRMLGGLDGLIQTDAAINPGNSGGALVDLEGRLVGIPTMVLAQGQNIGFAIPSWQVELVVSQFRRYGKAQHPWVGIAGATEVVDPVMARALDLPERGVVVAGVEPGGPADRAGLQEFDMIVAAGGSPTPSIQALRRQIRRSEVGDVITLELLRSGRTFQRELRVQEMPQAIVDR